MTSPTSHFKQCPYILQALAKTLTANQLFYLREQFELLGPNKNGYISLQNLKTVGILTFVTWSNL